MMTTDDMIKEPAWGRFGRAFLADGAAPDELPRVDVQISNEGETHEKNTSHCYRRYHCI